MSRTVKNAAAVAVVMLLLYVVPLRELWAALCELTVSAIVYLAAVSVALILVSALKWKIFLDAFGNRVSLAKLFALYVMGYFVNTLLPSYVGGDVARSFYAGKEVGQHQAAAATVLERYTGLVAMITLALVFMWFSSQATVAIKIAVAGLALGLAVITLIAVSEKVRLSLERFKELKPILKHVQQIQGAFAFLGRDTVLISKALGLSFVYHCLTVVNTAIAAYAVGWIVPSYTELFVVLPLILLFGALPLVPNGLGLQEGAFLFFLSGIGASPAQALGVGVVLRVKSFILAIAGGFIWLRLRAQIPGKSASQ